MTAAASKTPGIYKKILNIRENLNVEKTGYDEKNDYYYYKADDVAAAVREGMNKHGVIHHAKLVDVIDGSRVDAQGRERSRFTTHSVISFIDVEDGSTFEHEVIASGSDIGGDKAPRKTAVQAFKIAAIDLFMVVEGLEKFDSDGDKEAEPEAVVVSAAAKASKTIRELDQAIGAIIKADNLVTPAVLKSLADELAEKHGIAQDSKVWRKETKVLEPLLEILEKSLGLVTDGTTGTIEEAIALAKSGTGEVD